MGDSWALAMGIAISPTPVVPLILLMLTARPRANSVAFLGGWTIGIAVGTTVFVVFAEVLKARNYTPAWVSWTLLVIGAALIVLGIYEWLARARPKPEPRWIQAIQAAGPVHAFLLGFLVSAANLKVLVFAAGAGVAIGSAKLTSLGEVAAILWFTLLAGSSAVITTLLYLTLGDRILGPVTRAKDWLLTNYGAIKFVVLTTIGLYLVVKGIRGL
jgi:threonine/homoserine/homoserine lactone efflux protein